MTEALASYDDRFLLGSDCHRENTGLWLVFQ